MLSRRSFAASASPSSLTEHLHLSVTVGSGRELSKLTTSSCTRSSGNSYPVSGVTKVGRSGEEQRPCTYPQPELLLLVRIKGKVIRLRAVTLKETGKRLPGIHHTEITGIMYQLLVSIGRWRGGGDKAVGNIRKQGEGTPGRSWYRNHVIRLASSNDVAVKEEGSILTPSSPSRTRARSS